MHSSDTNHNSPATVLVISATDSGGCAGMQADLRVCASLRIFAVCAVTSVTAQNSRGVKGYVEVPRELLRQQILCAVAQNRPQAVKIGLLVSAESVQTVFETLGELGISNIILDPVFNATAGPIVGVGMEKWRREVLNNLRNVSLLTPNIPELSFMAKRPVESYSDILDAVALLFDSTDVKSLLVKGGHGVTDSASDTCTDLFFTSKTTTPRVFTSQKIDTSNLRGTGCTLSTAIACYSALGYNSEDALSKARSYLQEAIMSGCTASYEGGAGPVDHFVHIKP